MARKFTLRDSSSSSEDSSGEGHLIDRREFMRHSFNTAAGVITVASIGTVGFASLLMGQAEADGHRGSTCERRESQLEDAKEQK